MRIILTESQLELLKIIYEVAGGFTKSIEKGGFVTVSFILDDKDDVSILEITKIHGNGQFIEGKNKGGVYLFDLSTALSTTENTFTGLKYGKYIPPQKNEEGKIISAPQIAGGSKVTLKNVIKVEVSNSSKQTVDTITTDLGIKRDTDADDNDKISKDKEQNIDNDVDQESDEVRDKRIMKMAMNDPTIRKMMYHQPSLLGGLIKIGKAKGIATVGNIINKYNKNKGGDNKRTPKEFLKNKYYEFETLIPVNVNHGLKVFKLYVGEWYNVQYDGNAFNGHAGERENKISYTIKPQKKNSDGSYKAELDVKFLEKGEGRYSPNRVETKTDIILIRIKNKS